jgi:acetyl-CoA carboxylase carboxyl transferase subunit beta
LNWLSNFVRPKIQALVRKREVPDNLWTKCSNCGQMIHHKEIKLRQFVCQHCDHHLRIGPEDRFPNLFDNGKFITIELPDVLIDPLKFRDEKRYTDRLKESKSKTGQKDAVVVAHGKLGGHGAVIAVQNFSFMGGSLGLGAAEAIITAAKLAVLKKAPLIIFVAAGGARMQEGILSLMQLPRTTIAVQLLQETGLPYISVLTDPTTGGVTASYAMLGDVAISEPGALIGFAGPRVIENTIRERLPEGFQRAEYLLEHGMLDMVVHRHAMRETLIRVMELLGNRPPSAAVTSLPQPGLEIPSLTDSRQKGHSGEPGGTA